jgi:hypothetical protein
MCRQKLCCVEQGRDGQIEVLIVERGVDTSPGLGVAATPPSKSLRLSAGGKQDLPTPIDVPN